MEFFKVVEKRHSVRSFSPEEITEEQISKIISAAQAAPSAGGLEAREVIAVKDPEKKRALSDAALGQSSVSQAPVVFAFLADPEKSASKYGERGRKLYCIQDATVSCAYAQLAAEDLGLSSVWVGAFDESKVAELLDAGGKVPVALLPVGKRA